MRRGAALLLLAAACVSAPRTRWEESGGPLRDGGELEVAAPPGWMRSTETPRSRFLLTRDGVPLQWILVGTTRVGEPLPLRANKRALPAGLSPLETCDYVLDLLRADASFSRVRLVESAPATVAGAQGWRLTADYRLPSGLAVRLAAYGAMRGDRLDWALYAAPARHYFARDLATFEHVVESVRAAGAR
ncbi:MAG: hypothetical protein ACJ79L_13685 [Anaeromyxobacteraceae bacterium]